MPPPRSDIPGVATLPGGSVPGMFSILWIFLHTLPNVRNNGRKWDVPPEELIEVVLASFHDSVLKKENETDATIANTYMDSMALKSIDGGNPARRYKDTCVVTYDAPTHHAGRDSRMGLYHLREESVWVLEYGSKATHVPPY